MGQLPQLQVAGGPRALSPQLQGTGWAPQVVSVAPATGVSRSPPHPHCSQHRPEPAPFPRTVPEGAVLKGSSVKHPTGEPDPEVPAGLPVEGARDGESRQNKQTEGRKTENITKCPWFYTSGATSHDPRNLQQISSHLHATLTCISVGERGLQMAPCSDSTRQGLSVPPFPPSPWGPHGCGVWTESLSSGLGMWGGGKRTGGTQ